MYRNRRVLITVAVLAVLATAGFAASQVAERLGAVVVLEACCGGGR